MSHRGRDEDVAFREALGEVLHERRRSLRLSQEGVARRAGLCRQTLSKYETGVNEMSLVQALRLSHALRLSPMDLLAAVRERLETQQTPAPARAAERRSAA
jgi:transcriptional regulator with XRE-family HTH domain